MISLSANTNDSRFQGKEASLCIILVDTEDILEDIAPEALVPEALAPVDITPWDIIPMDTARRPRRP